MEILQRDRILTKLFLSDIAIIINLYVIDYIVPNNVDDCVRGVEYYKMQHDAILYKPQINCLKTHLQKYDTYPELKKLTQHIMITDYSTNDFALNINIRLECTNFVICKYPEWISKQYTFRHTTHSFSHTHQISNKLREILQIHHTPEHIFNKFLECVADTHIY